MDGVSWSVLWAAAAVAVLHTALGPDHTLPFIALARASGWSLRRALGVALACGAGHVAASLLLGALGLGLGYGVGRLEGLNGGRAELAAWVLVAFGLAYGAWGARKAARHAAGLVPHEHPGLVHVHAHGDRSHGHAGRKGLRGTSWMLFAVFVVGPCEPLIPLFVLPASRGRWALAGLAAALYTALTLATMLTLVAAGLAGVERLRSERLDRWSHALAGCALAVTGLSVLLLDL